MPVRRYAVCDECESDKIEYSTLKNRDATNFRYEDIVDSGEPKFAEVEGWTVKALQCPDDPIAVEHEFYCPECSSKDQLFSAGR